MTRATLLATTTALLLPLTGAFAQSTDTDTGVNAGTAGAPVSAATEGDATTGTVENMQDQAGSAANDAVREAAEAAEQIGDAATSAAQDAAEGAEQAMDDVANTIDSEAEATAQAGGTTVGEITGAEVVDAAGEVIGSVEMVVEQADGKAAVIGVGGFLGLGEHDVAVPAADLSRDAEGRLKLSRYTEADLRQRPEFNSTDAVTLDADVELPEIG